MIKFKKTDKFIYNIAVSTFIKGILAIDVEYTIYIAKIAIKYNCGI